MIRLFSHAQSARGVRAALAGPAERSDGDVRAALEGLAARRPRRGARRWPRSPRPPLSSQERAKRVIGAKGGTRTPTVLLPPAPQAGASANSATFARRAGIRAHPIEAASLKPNRHSSTRPGGGPVTQAAEKVSQDGENGDADSPRRGHAQPGPRTVGQQGEPERHERDGQPHDAGDRHPAAALETPSISAAIPASASARHHGRTLARQAPNARTGHPNMIATLRAAMT